MTKQPRLALDAMGGDDAPRIVIEGADIAIDKNPELKLVFVGVTQQIKPLLARPDIFNLPKLCIPPKRLPPRRGYRKPARRQANLDVESHRAGRQWRGRSGGIGRKYRRINGDVQATIADDRRDKPSSYCRFFPNSAGQSCVLDLGANIECDAKNLIQFAVMGSAFYRDIYGVGTPSVGLLNVGEEDQKGFDYLREAAKVLNLERLGVNYQGFVEGSDITKGRVDVIVTDGFTGNAALKTAEGVANLFQQSMRQAFSANLMQNRLFAGQRRCR